MTSDLSELSDMYDTINNHSCGSFDDHTVYRINVVNAISSLCSGKSDGVDGMCSDNLNNRN